MNLSEFKAWFEGFTENLDGTPNKKQWARIQERVDDISNMIPTPYPIYIEKYVEPYKPYFEKITWGRPTGNAYKLSSCVSTKRVGDYCVNDPDVNFTAVGKAEFQSIM